MAQGKWVNQMRLWRDKPDAFLGPCAKCLLASGCETVDDLQNVDANALSELPTGAQQAAQRGYLCSFVAAMQKPVVQATATPLGSSSSAPLTLETLREKLAPEVQTKHVNFATALHGLSLRDAKLSLLPSQDATDKLATELVKLTKDGTQAPFVFSEAKEFAPSWALMQNATKNTVLPFETFCACLLRSLLASVAAQQMSFPAALGHFDTCMKVACQESHSAAVEYDRLARQRWAE